MLNRVLLYRIGTTYCTCNIKTSLSKYNLKGIATSFLRQPYKFKEPEGSYYLGATFWVLIPQCLRDKLEIFLRFSSNEVCDSAPNFVWIDLRASRSWGLLFCFLITVFHLHGEFPQTTLLIRKISFFFWRPLRS